MIERLFTSKIRVKLLELFLFSEGSFGIRELERKLGLSVSAVKRELDNLSEISILVKENKKFKINPACSFLDSLIDIFLKTDYFKIEFENIFLKVKTNFVFVFGSLVNSDFNADSDVDLFVVGELSMTYIIKLLNSLEKKLGREINVVVWSLKELKEGKNKSFIKDIAKKHILMIKGKENELRKIIGRK